MPVCLLLTHPFYSNMHYKEDEDGYLIFYRQEISRREPYTRIRMITLDEAYYPGVSKSGAGSPSKLHHAHEWTRR
jgi:hypothetical protein